LVLSQAMSSRDKLCRQMIQQFVSSFGSNIPSFIKWVLHVTIFFFTYSSLSSFFLASSWWMNTPSKLTVGWRPLLTCPRTDEHIAGSLSGTELAGSHGHELVCPGPFTSLCLSWLAHGRRGVGGWSSSQQPPEAQRVAQMEVASAQNLQAAACRRREADPVGGRRRREAGQWWASDELCRGQRQPASLRPARGCHSF